MQDSSYPSEVHVLYAEPLAKGGGDPLRLCQGHGFCQRSHGLKIKPGEGNEELD